MYQLLVPGAGFGFSISLTMPGPDWRWRTVALHVVRRRRGIAVPVAEPDRVAVAEHDVVGAGAAVDGLVEVVAHGVVVGQALEVGHVALLHVVEAQRGGAFAGGLGRG